MAMPPSNHHAGEPYVPQGTLEIEADLELTVEGERARVSGEGSTLVIDLPSLGAARRLLRYLPPSDSARDTVHDLDDGLRAVGMTVDVRVDGVTVARSGSAARPGGISRLFGMGEVELGPGALLRGARPAAIAGVAVTGALAVALWNLFRRR